MEKLEGPLFLLIYQSLCILLHLIFTNTPCDGIVAEQWSPKHVCVLIPGTSEYVVSSDKGELRLLIR